MPFHRLVTPTYFGGLPVGYDYINDPVANGDAGVAAFADAKKTTGPNEGTYFIAFQEDATSNFANRGLQALAENTDFIDNILRKDLALTARTADVLAGAPVSQIVLAGQTFVGEFGVANNQDQRDRLISVLDSSDNEIIDAAGVRVLALLIHDGASNNVVGTQATGFFNTPTVNLNVAIPTGTTYRVYYGERGSLANLPKNAFTEIKIRGAQEVEAEVERVFRDLHATSGAVWNDPWVATVNSLARTGLDGRYRHTTTDPGTGPALNTPGAGGTITRDGPAVTMSLPTYNLGVGGIGAFGGTRYPDSLMASFRLRRAAPVVGTAWDPTLGGDVGLMQESPFHTTSDANEVAFSHVTAPLVLDVIPRDIRASTLGGNAVLTRISTTALATLNPTAGSDATSRRTIEVGAGDFVRDGSSRTALRSTDFIEVTDNATGLVIGTYKVDTITAVNRFTVKAVTGDNPSLGPSGATGVVRLRWLQPTLCLGGRQNEAGAGGSTNFMVIAPGILHSAWDTNYVPVSAAFLSALNDRSTSASNISLYTSMAWGGFGTDGAFSLKGRLYGDGGFECLGGRQTRNLPSRRFTQFNIPDGGGAAALNPFSFGSATIATVAALLTTSVAVFSIDTTGGYSPVGGDEITIYVKITTGTTGDFSITWPGNFIFSGDDGVVPLHNTTGQEMVIRFDFMYMDTGVTVGWYARRTDYGL